MDNCYSLVVYQMNRLDIIEPIGNSIKIILRWLVCEIKLDWNELIFDRINYLIGRYLYCNKKRLKVHLCDYKL